MSDKIYISEPYIINDIFQKIWAMGYDAGKKDGTEKRLKFSAIKDLSIADFYKLDYLDIRAMKHRIDKEFFAPQKVYEALQNLAQVLGSEEYEKTVLEYYKTINDKKFGECIIEF